MLNKVTKELFKIIHKEILIHCIFCKNVHYSLYNNCKHVLRKITIFEKHTIFRKNKNDCIIH